MTTHAVVTVQQAGQTLAVVPVNSASAGQCNWLEDEKPEAGLGPGQYLASYIIEDAQVDMRSLLKSHQTYSVSVKFVGNPPPGCSLWLCGVRRNEQAWGVTSDVFDR